MVPNHATVLNVIERRHERLYVVNPIGSLCIIVLHDPKIENDAAYTGNAAQFLHKGDVVTILCVGVWDHRHKQFRCSLLHVEHTGRPTPTEEAPIPQDLENDTPPCTTNKKRLRYSMLST
jgi:hypothetical protein